MLFIVDSDADTLLSMRRLLYAAGILTGEGSYRTAILYVGRAPLDAVLLTNPYDEGKPPRFCSSFRARHPGVPVIMLSKPLKAPTEDMGKADLVLPCDLPPKKFTEKLLIGLSSALGYDYADCIFGRARDHLLMPSPTWNGYELPLTPAERAIFRYLIRAELRPVPPQELLRYCMKPGTSPTLCNITSHIYRINYKAEKILGYHIVGMSESQGYRLLVEVHT